MYFYAILRRLNALRGMDMKFDTLFFERKSSFSIRNRYRFWNRQISSACLQCAEHSNTGECSLLNRMPFIEKYLNGNRTQSSLQFICHSFEHLPKCFSLWNYLSKLFARCSLRKHNAFGPLYQLLRFRFAWTYP